MTTLIDTHCHLQDEQFEGGVSGAVARMREAGVAAAVVCGYDAPSNLAALRLAAEFPGLRPAVGFHPHDATALTPAALAVLRHQACLPEVVAVGEIGLDFYRDLSPRDIQQRALDAQLEIAIETGKPVSVHTRAAEDAIYPYLAAYAARSPLAAMGRPAGVMHCFGGTAEQARAYTAIGFLVSIPCTITYPNNEMARRIAMELPLECLVIETDSPYLPPRGHRGQRNEPALVRAAAEAIAAARGISFDAVAEATTANAARLFALPIPVEAA